MNQLHTVSNLVSKETVLPSELLAGALHHLRNAMETGSRRSCAISCMLFSCLAQDPSLDDVLCEECKGMGECLEGLTELAAWGNRP